MFKNEWNGKDFYAILGVSKGATETEIKKAHRKLARTYHPDINNEPGAEDKFKEVSEAYGVLNDPEARKAYDGGPGVSFEGLFGGFGGFGGDSIPDFSGEAPDMSHLKDFLDNSEMEDLLRKARIHLGTEEEAPQPKAESGSKFDFGNLFNTVKAKAENLRYPNGHPDSNGLKAGMDSPVETPAEIVMNVSITFEESCKGIVKKVSDSEGNSFDMRIPAGIKDGQSLRLKNGKGKVKVHVEKHDVFSYEGNELTLLLPISLNEAVAGGVKRFDLPTGDQLAINLPGNSANKVIRVPGKGMKGKDLRVKPFIKLPDTLTDAHVNAAKEFEKAG